MLSRGRTEDYILGWAELIVQFRFPRTFVLLTNFAAGDESVGRF